MSNDSKDIPAGILTPHLVQKIWGGNKLAKLKNLQPSTEKGLLGESWEVSCHGDGASAVAGVSLKELIKSEELPYLVKFIDTSDYLSVQVHPDDDYALEHENQSGKTECWFILDAEESCGIYLGLSKDVDKIKLKQALEAGDDLTDLLNFIPVEKGDFLYVPAGSIHSIGKGVTLLEVQQSSGVTYRVWDWNRVDENGKGRSLHIDKAMDVINFLPEANTSENFKIQKKVLSQNTKQQIVTHPHFCVEVFPNKSKAEKIKNLSQKHWALINVEKTLELIYEEKKIKLPPYTCFFLPIGKGLEVCSSKGPYLLIK